MDDNNLLQICCKIVYLYVHKKYISLFKDKIYLEVCNFKKKSRKQLSK